jgi:two-component system cell cycle response regulator
MDAYIPPSPPTILVVDDIAEITALVRFLLEERGVRVFTAHDGATALRLLSQERLDALVLDLAMPGLDGYAVIRQVRQDPERRHMPIVVLSGLGQKKEAIQAGADSYMEKPCHPDKLLADILRLLQPR